MRFIKNGVFLMFNNESLLNKIEKVSNFPSPPERGTASGTRSPSWGGRRGCPVLNPNVTRPRHEAHGTEVAEALERRKTSFLRGSLRGKLKHYHL